MGPGRTGESVWKTLLSLHRQDLGMGIIDKLLRHVYQEPLESMGILLLGVVLGLTKLS